MLEVLFTLNHLPLLSNELPERTISLSLLFQFTHLFIWTLPVSLTMSNEFEIIYLFALIMPQNDKPLLIMTSLGRKKIAYY